MLYAAILMLQAASTQGFELGELEARLFYKETGRLSENILSQRREFTFHNTIIGEGDAEEAADDLLISIAVINRVGGTPEQNQKMVDEPVKIVARDRTGKLLGSRTHASTLTSFNGIERKVLWLTDVTCAGEVTIVATFGNQIKTTKLIMGFGE